MKLKLDADVVDDFSDLVTGDFLSTLPPASTLRKAWADPTAKYLTSNAELGRALALNGVRAFRFATARVGVDVGIPAAVVGDFGRALSLSGSDQAVQGWVDFVSGATDAVIDIACEAMGAVPFVGWLAKGIKAAIDLIGQRLANQRPKPALLEYDKPDDDFQANRMLARLRSLDWTFAFMPAYSPEDWADWEIIEAQTGFLMKPKSKFTLEGNSGAIPGGALGSLGVQSRNCWAQMPSLKPAPSGGVSAAKSNLDVMLDAYARDRGDVVECIFDLYETTPSVARVAVVAWQQMTAKKTAALFQVDTRSLQNAWNAYVTTAIAASRAHTKTITEFGGLKWTAWRNLEEAMYPRGFKVSDKPQRTATLDVIAGLYTGDLRRRQRAALDTLLVAYAQEGQAAFKDPALRSLLHERRTQLLLDDARWTIKAEDILDLPFRAAWRDSTRNPGDRPFGKVPRPRPQIPDATPLPEPDLDPSGGGGGAGGLIAVAGLLGLGYATRRWWMRRGR